MDYINRCSGMTLVSDDTGEALEVDISPGDLVRIIRAQSMETAMRISRENVPVNAGRQFVKIFPDVIPRLCRDIGKDGVVLLTLLLPYVGANSGILRHTNGQFVSRQYIVEICGDVLSRAAVDRALGDLVRHGVMAKCWVKDKKAYIVNPYLFQNGSKANQTLLSLFQDSGWRR